MSPHSDPDIEEHELPRIEAVLAGTLVLMTGYSQALQAELHPRQRLLMGEKIGDNLTMLIQHPQLSLGFRQVLLGLQGRWLAMGRCTCEAARDCVERHGRDAALPAHACVAAPERLQ
jgi:hypothetical protein